MSVFFPLLSSRSDPPPPARSYNYYMVTNEMADHPTFWWLCLVVPAASGFTELAFRMVRRRSPLFSLLPFNSNNITLTLTLTLLLSPPPLRPQIKREFYPSLVDIGMEVDAGAGQSADLFPAAVDPAGPQADDGQAQGGRELSAAAQSALRHSALLGQGRGPVYPLDWTSLALMLAALAPGEKVRAAYWKDLWCFFDFISRHMWSLSSSSLTHPAAPCTLLSSHSTLFHPSTGQAASREHRGGVGRRGRVGHLQLRPRHGRLGQPQRGRGLYLRRAALPAVVSAAQAGGGRGQRGLCGRGGGALDAPGAGGHVGGCQRRGRGGRRGRGRGRGEGESGAMAAGRGGRGCEQGRRGGRGAGRGGSRGRAGRVVSAGGADCCSCRCPCCRPGPCPSCPEG